MKAVALKTHTLEMEQLAQAVNNCKHSASTISFQASRKKKTGIIHSDIFEINDN